MSAVLQPARAPASTPAQMSAAGLGGGSLPRA
jgi:hypothetical protein